MLRSNKRSFFTFIIFLILGFFTNINAKEFTFVSYNVENLFDLEKNGQEYDEYVPDSKFGWNEKSHKIKIQNISKVLMQLNGDIVVLSEIENRNALKILVNELEQKGLKYFYEIADSKDSSVKSAILSKFKIVKKNEVVTGKGKQSRNILEAWVEIEGKELIVFANHWQSKRKPESHRIRYAKALKKRIDELGGKEFIIAGDLNSNHNEAQTFLTNKLNDTKGLTGINHILKTYKTNEYVTKEDLLGGDFLYNLWYDLEPEKRFSHIFRGEKGTLDHILIPYGLKDRKNIEYIDNSFNKFDEDYLFEGKEVKRWEMKKTFLGLGTSADGYSDHLPIYAKFKVIK